MSYSASWRSSSRAAGDCGQADRPAGAASSQTMHLTAGAALNYFVCSTKTIINDLSRSARREGKIQGNFPIERAKVEAVKS